MATELDRKFLPLAQQLLDRFGTDYKLVYSVGDVTYTKTLKGYLGTVENNPYGSYGLSESQIVAYFAGADLEDWQPLDKFNLIVEIPKGSTTTNYECLEVVEIYSGEKVALVLVGLRA